MWGKVRKKPAPFAFDRVAGYGTLFLVGGLLGMLLLPEQEAFATGNIEILVAGRKLDREQEANEAAIAMGETYLAETFTITAAAERVELPRRALGARVDIARLRSLIEQARDPRSPLRRVHWQTLASDPLNLPIPVEIDAEKTIDGIVRLKDAVEQPGRSASLAGRRAAKSPRQAVLLDIQGTVDAVEGAMLAGGNSARARLVRRPGAGGGGLSPADIDVSDVVGVFETRIDPERLPEEQRLRLQSAAEAIDGHVLREQEVFDFNRMVAALPGGDAPALPGNEEKGKVAEPDGPDPCTCQAASTLHAAALFAGLPILERHPHPHTPEHVKLGLDAAAGQEKLNLRFRNDLPFPIAIGMTVGRASVRVELRGVRRTRTVTLERTIVSAIPFKKRHLEDPLLPEGVRILSRRGIPGFIVRSVRTVKREPGKRESSERARDVYRPLAEIWRTGTAPLDTPVKKLPENDTRAEFLVDEFLVATQGPGIRGFDVRRKPGITGTHGWTSRGQFLKNRSRQIQGVAYQLQPQVLSGLQQGTIPSMHGSLGQEKGLHTTTTQDLP
jgi:hypothetical protein